MSQNPDAVANQGEFRGKVAPSEPMMKSGVSQTLLLRLLYVQHIPESTLRNFGASKHLSDWSSPALPSTPLF